LFAFLRTSSKTGLSIDSGAVSLYGPFLALVIAVLAKETITTSSSLFGPTYLELNDDWFEKCLFKDSNLPVFSI
jgi:hypothetical protein